MGVALFGAFAGASGEHIVAGLRTSAVTSAVLLVVAAALAAGGIRRIQTKSSLQK